MEQLRATRSMGILERIYVCGESVLLNARYGLMVFYFSLGYPIVKMAIDAGLLLTGRAEESLLITDTLTALQLLDITMIVNFVWLIGAGSMLVFVKKFGDLLASSDNRPHCLLHLSSGLLKEKMAGSLIGISSVHLLKVFLDIPISGETVNLTNLGCICGIHLMFIVGLVAFARVNGMPHHQHVEETNHHEKKE